MLGEIKIVSQAPSKRKQRQLEQQDKLIKNALHKTFDPVLSEPIPEFMLKIVNASSASNHW